MLESGLFFALGFLCAALLALMVAPAIWRRAVVLTRQRIESSVPLTLNEIQADKDQLRAEFAMSTRRLEVNLETLKKRAAEQIVEVSRRREELQQLQEERDLKAERVADLEAQSAELRSQMKEREEKLSQLTSRSLDLETSLEDRTLALEDLQEKYNAVLDDLDSNKIENVARETKFGSIEDAARDAKKEVANLNAQIDQVKSELRITRSALTKEKGRTKQLDEKLLRQQASLSDLEARLERRDSDLKRLRGKDGHSGTRVTELEQQLDAATSENFQLQAQVSETVLRMDTLLRDASGENVENALATFEGQQEDMREQIVQLERERNELRKQISAIEVASGDDWAVERRENAIVRERINDLAARVTSMTAQMEGPDSPIHDALSKDTGQTKSTPKRRKKSSDTIDDAVDEVNTLADRIRALQSAGK